MNKEIYCFPLNTEKVAVTAIREFMEEDKELEEYITTYSEMLKKDDIETWERDKNMIVTEKGYYIAVYGNE